MQEKCYRHLQTPSGIGGVGLFELLALLAVPILLFPVFVIMELSFIYILGVEIMLAIVFRMANKISPFPHGLISFVSFNFLWPKKLSAFKLQEQEYFSRKK